MEITCQGTYRNKVRQPECLSYFCNIVYLSLYYIYFLLFLRQLMGHEGLATLHKVARISCMGKLANLILLSHLIRLARMMSFSVTRRIFHSLTAQATWFTSPGRAPNVWTGGICRY